METTGPEKDVSHKFTGCASDTSCVRGQFDECKKQIHRSASHSHSPSTSVCSRVYTYTFFYQCGEASKNRGTHRSLPGLCEDPCKAMVQGRRLQRGWGEMVSRIWL